MSSTLLERPPPRVETRPPPRPDRAPDPPRRRGGARWAVPLAVSAALHLLALLLFRFELVFPTRPPDDPLVLDQPTGMLVYEIVPVTETPASPQDEEAPEPTPPEEAQTPAPEEAQTQPPEEAQTRPLAPLQPPSSQPGRLPAAGTAPAGGRAPSSISGRVSPRMGDPRLWDPPALPAEPPVHRDEVVRRRLTSRIDLWNDSVRLAEQSAAKAVDWTVKDGENGRWGVSPKGIHLGSFTLPIPILFATPPGRRDGASAAQRNWSEIQGQRGRAAAQEDIKDRIKAIRERKQAERRDTTRGGGS